MRESEILNISNKNKKIALAVILPLALIGGGVALYFALKPKKCPDGMTDIPKNPFTGKRDLLSCPDVQDDASDANSNGNGEGQVFGDAGVTTLGRCSFPLKNQSGSQGDEKSRICVSKVKQALAPEINQIGWFDENVYGTTVEKALDDFLENEVSNDEEPLAKMKQIFGGCGNWLQGYSNCKIENDQYRQLLEKRNIDVEWSEEFEQWR